MKKSKVENKITWLSVLQGWSMLLVVIGHVTLTNEFKNPDTPVSAEIERIIYTFHMPLFMFVSGFLLYYTKIVKNKAYKSVIHDKGKRLMVPFLFFTVCAFILKYFFAGFMKNPSVLSLQEVVDIVTFKSNPLAEMWFVSTLFELFLFYPVYKLSLKNNISVCFMLCFCLVIHLFVPEDIDLFNLSRVSYHMIFLYAGILFSKYNIINYLSRIIPFISCMLLFFFLNVFAKESIPIAPPFAGIFFSVALCLFLSKHLPGLFDSFRNYTFQIFLMGIFFQMLIRFLYARIGMPELYWLLYMISILLGLYVPVFISKIIERIKLPSVRLLFGL